MGIINRIKEDTELAFYFGLGILIVIIYVLIAFRALPFYNPKNYRESISYDKYGCTEDCSGHEAGYEWAREKDITDPDNCGGKSTSFIAGCEAYALDY